MLPEIIGADSTGSGKSAPVPSAQPVQQYHFVPAMISVVLSYIKMVNITATESVIAATDSPKCFCGWFSTPDFAGRAKNAGNRDAEGSEEG